MESPVVGIKPWLPPPLSTSPWWTAPIAAERLAAVRIAVGLTLVLDALTTYLPQAKLFFGRGSLTGTEPFPHSPAVAHRMWLMTIGNPSDPFDPLGAYAWQALFIALAFAGLMLALGILPRLAAGFAWFVSMSLVQINPWLHNAGDQVRTILLFMMMVSPCAATWSILRRDAGVKIYPWPVRLLTVQLAAIYFMNGLFKALGDEWRSGDAMITLLGDSGWIRWPVTEWGIPDWFLRVSVWLVMLWEIAFPVLIYFPRARFATLAFGVAFHLATAVSMRVGMFPWYTLCLYLMFVPWERIGGSKSVGVPANDPSKAPSTSIQEV